MGQVLLNPGALFLFSEGRKREGPKRSESLYFPSTLSSFVLYIRVPCGISSEKKKKVGFLFFVFKV